MISARLRFVVLVAAAVAAAAMAILYARASILFPGALPCLVLAGFLAEAAAHVRRTAHRLQERHRQALLLAELEAIESRPGWCCEPVTTQPAERHVFAQDPQAETVHVCRCGKWPDHHTHISNTVPTVPCSCDTCRTTT